MKFIHIKIGALCCVMFIFYRTHENLYDKQPNCHTKTNKSFSILLLESFMKQTPLFCLHTQTQLRQSESKVVQQHYVVTSTSQQLRNIVVTALTVNQ